MQALVVPYDPSWPADFASESESLRSLLSDVVAEIHHIGSTAIPGIHAKPIIDMLMIAPDLDALDAASPRLVPAGYAALGEYGIPGRRYFRKHNPEGVRTHHLHAFEPDSPGATRHLAFRDFMRAHPERAQAYSNLKRQLAEMHEGDMEAYMDGKDEFVKTAERDALAWIRGGGEIR